MTGDSVVQPDIMESHYETSSATDGNIDRLVYELYDLTDEEIRIVEEATQRGPSCGALCGSHLRKRRRRKIDANNRQDL